MEKYNSYESVFMTKTQNLNEIIRRDFDDTQLRFAESG